MFDAQNRQYEEKLSKLEAAIIEKDEAIKELREENIHLSQANASFKISEIELQDRLALLT